MRDYIDRSVFQSLVEDASFSSSSSGVRPQTSGLERATEVRFPCTIAGTIQVPFAGKPKPSQHYAAEAAERHRLFLYRAEHLLRVSPRSAYESSGTVLAPQALAPHDPVTSRIRILLPGAKLNLMDKRDFRDIASGLADYDAVTYTVSRFGFPSNLMFVGRRKLSADISASD